MKSIWTGNLSFGLVTIPVNLYSAVEAQALGFKMLCATCNQPITYKRWCDHCNKEVPWSSVVKGIKLKEDTYFVLTQENLHKLKPVKTDAITITEFVSPALIGTIYLEKHYYLAPKKEGDKAFFLLVKALDAAHKVAIGTFVMRDKEHVSAIYPYGQGLLLTTLNYAYEIKDMDSITTLKTVPALNDQELNLALELIGQYTRKSFDITNYKDDFAERLAAVIKKGQGKKAIIKEAPEEKVKITKDNTLMTALRASLEKSKSKIPVARASHKPKSRHVLKAASKR